METALKVGFGKELSFRSSPTIYFDELWSLNAQNGASSDDFLVDELLDFSNEDGFVEEEAAEGEEDNKNSFFSSVSVSAPLQQPHHDSHENSNQSSSTSSEDDFWSVSSRDFEDLEWLSHIVADSSQEYSATPSCVFLKENPNNPKETTHPLLRFGISSMPSHLKTPLPSKPRSRRARISGRVWSLASPSPSSTSSVMYSSSSSSCPSLSNPRPNHPHPREKLSAKKPKKKWTTIDGPGRVPSPRRCSHCGVQKTPQWRAGPLGAKSLCNACGVRFKSGRLFPEYRPACSPTFSSELHSNHHRKVLEMRQKKDTEEEDQSRPEVEEENGVNPIGTA